MLNLKLRLIKEEQKIKKRLLNETTATTSAFYSYTPAHRGRGRFLIAFLLLVILGVFRTVGEVIQTVGVIFRTVGEVFFLHPEASLHPVGELLSF